MVNGGVNLKGSLTTKEGTIGWIPERKRMGRENEKDQGSEDFTRCYYLNRREWTGSAGGLPFSVTVANSIIK